MSASSDVTEAAKPKKSKLPIITLVIAVAALAFTFLKPGAAPVAAPDAAEEEHTEPAEPKPGAVVEVGTMTVNLADAGRFARVSFAVVLVEVAEGEAEGGGGHGGGEEEGAPGPEAKFPLLKEAVLFEFSKVTSQDLRAPGGLDMMAKRLSERAREVYEHGEVLRVVLTELLVQ